MSEIEDQGHGRDPDRIPMILAALERQWRKAPDERFGQLIVNLVRGHAGLAESGEPSVRSVLWGIEDGQLLTWLGPETDAEKTYVREEPSKRRRGWSAWIRQSRDITLPLPADVRLDAEREPSTCSGAREAVPIRDVLSGWAKTPKANKKLR